MSAVLDSSDRIDPARCHPDIRVAVTEEIMDWIEDNSSAPLIMRMYGPAGEGKLVLVQTICELCKQKGWPAASFFFSRTAPGRNNGHTLIPTIATHVVIPRNTPSYPKMYQERPLVAEQIYSNRYGGNHHRFIQLLVWCHLLLDYGKLPFLVGFWLGSAPSCHD